MPAAELPITLEFATRLVGAQFPDLLRHPFHSLTEGWDNVVVRIGPEYAVRIPRREAAVELARNEHRWLAPIAQRSRFPVPAPLRLGRPSDFYPWPWSIVPWIEGTRLSDTGIGARARLAAELARFIRDLHAPAPLDAPHNPVRGVPLLRRDEVVRTRLATGTVPRSDELLRLWLTLRETDAWSGPPLWLHGDLHPGNLLVLDGRLAGVIDFGDLTAGDPAGDLAVGWLAFDSPDRRVFLSGLPAAYRTDRALLARARGWALVLATAFAAHSDDNPGMAAIGRHAIEQVLVGDTGLEPMTSSV